MQTELKVEKVNKMGKVLSTLTRPLRNWNIENRAEKFISKEKPTPAPRHKTKDKQCKRVIKEEHSAEGYADEKTDVLMKHLKQVYVSSEDPEILERPKRNELENKIRPLPKERYTKQAFEFGYLEPNSVPQGKLSLRQALQAISNHQQDPEKWSAFSVAKEHNLDLHLTEKLLEHFRTFELHTFEEKYMEDRENTSKYSLQEKHFDTSALQERKEVSPTGSTEKSGANIPLPINVKKK